MSCSKWRWTEECDTQPCPGDCDFCGFHPEEEFSPKEEAEHLILAIDPGNNFSGWVLMDADTYRPVRFGKDENGLLLGMILFMGKEQPPKEDGLVFDLLPAVDHVVIEMVASYGMPVGREVFETCVAIGKFELAANLAGVDTAFVYRREEKLAICHSPRANDATIRQALVDRFADGASNHGKGTKKEPGFFYGFKADIWQAFAVGVAYLDKIQEAKDAQNDR